MSGHGSIFFPNWSKVSDILSKLFFFLKKIYATFSECFNFCEQKENLFSKWSMKPSNGYLTKVVSTSCLFDYFIANEYLELSCALLD